jgi:acetyl esterase/lipase
MTQTIGPPPPYDPECAAAYEALPPRPSWITPDMIPAARVYEPPQPLEVLRRGGAYDVEERPVPGPPDAPDVPLAICRPTAGAGRPLAAIYHVHGGGMIVGDNRGHLPELLDLVAGMGVLVASPEYRLAPEHPDPAPVEDCYAGLVWLATHAEELGIDPDRILVAGMSAGGGLAAGLALLARDRGGPALRGQMLFCPMLDDRNDSVSIHQMADLRPWNRTSNDTGWTALLGTRRGTPEASPYAVPTRAADLAGLPPAFIDVGSADSFRDEDVAYATRIWQAGGVAELHVWPGGYHGFEYLAPHARLTRDAWDARLRWLRRVL